MLRGRHGVGARGLPLLAYVDGRCAGRGVHRTQVLIAHSVSWTDSTRIHAHVVGAHLHHGRLVVVHDHRPGLGHHHHGPGVLLLLVLILLNLLASLAQLALVVRGHRGVLQLLLVLLLLLLLLHLLQLQLRQPVLLLLALILLLEVLGKMLQMLLRLLLLLLLLQIGRAHV